MPVGDGAADLPAVVMGGGIGGLAAARLLTRHHRRVIVLERDVRDATAPEEAFVAWERPGVPQFRHSHAFLARIRQALLAHLPDVLERLREAGVKEIRLLDVAPPGMTFVSRPDDEDLVLLACRRSTFEWALRDVVARRPGVELREGVVIAGLVADEGGAGGRPRVTGVRLADGTVVPAALVVDATGRRSRAPDWLAAIGAPPVRERTADTGIFYYTRFYRLRRSGLRAVRGDPGGRAPRGSTGLVAGDLGWVKLAVFPGDHDTFSITVGAPHDEPRLRGLADPKRFERFLAAFPGMAPWRGRDASTPLLGPKTPVLVMGQLRNRLRHFVAGDEPVADGFVAIGDAAYHSNPIYGRGATCAVVQATLLDEALARHPDDPPAAALHLHRRSETELRGYWEAAVATDRRVLGDRRPHSLTDPLGLLVTAAEQGFGWFVDRGMVPASRVDPVVFRGLMRVFNMLEAPERLLRDPEVVVRSLPVLARVLTGDVPPAQFPSVSRALALARLEDAPARGR
jgi:2-polyprenyl-6-methoxyphenol hydroxylase-like FAD-dependent oxidoreductase